MQYIVVYFLIFIFCTKYCAHSRQWLHQYRCSCWSGQSQGAYNKAPGGFKQKIGLQIGLHYITEATKPGQNAAV